MWIQLDQDVALVADVVCSLKQLCLCIRLHDGADYPWRPTVSHSDFQKLLHNLTAIKIRGTYSEKSRGQRLMHTKQHCYYHTTQRCQAQHSNTTTPFTLMALYVAKHHRMITAGCFQVRGTSTTSPW